MLTRAWAWWGSSLLGLACARCSGERCVSDGTDGPCYYQLTDPKAFWTQDAQVAECETQVGCHIGDGCVEINCSAITELSTCNSAFPICRLDSNNVCFQAITAGTCYKYNAESNCSSVPGCAWSTNACVGEAVLCNYYSDKSSCLSNPKCMWGQYAP